MLNVARAADALLEHGEWSKDGAVFLVRAEFRDELVDALHGDPVWSFDPDAGFVQDDEL